MKAIIFALLLGTSLFSVSAFPVTKEIVAKFLFSRATAKGQTDRQLQCPFCPSTKSFQIFAQASCNETCAMELGCIVVNEGGPGVFDCFRCVLPPSPSPSPSPARLFTVSPLPLPTPSSSVTPSPAATIPSPSPIQFPFVVGSNPTVFVTPIPGVPIGAPIPPPVPVPSASPSANGTIIIPPSIAAVPSPSGPALTVTPTPTDIVFASVFPTDMALATMMP